MSEKVRLTLQIRYPSLLLWQSLAVHRRHFFEHLLVFKIELVLISSIESLTTLCRGVRGDCLSGLNLINLLAAVKWGYIPIYWRLIGIQSSSMLKRMFDFLNAYRQVSMGCSVLALGLLRA